MDELSSEFDEVEQFMSYVDQLERLGLDVRIGPEHTAMLYDEQGPILFKGKDWLTLTELGKIAGFAKKWEQDKNSNLHRQNPFFN